MVNKQYSVTRSNSNNPIQIVQPELGNLFRQSSCNNATPSATTTHTQYYKNITDYPLNLNAEHQMKLENVNYGENVEIVLGKQQDNKNINSNDLQYEKRNLDRFEYVLQMDREMVSRVPTASIILNRKHDLNYDHKVVRKV